MDCCHPKENLHLSLRFWVGLFFTFPVVVLSMSSMFPDFSQILSPQSSNLWQWLLSTPVIWGCGWIFFTKAWKSFKTGKLNMFTLIALGLTSSYVFSSLVVFIPSLFNHSQVTYFEGAAVITILTLLGQIFETRGRQNANSAISALIALSPKKAHVLKNGKEEDCDFDAIQKGDLIRIFPGEKIPVDGVVIEGDSYIDESMISGEAIPVRKQIDDFVVGATLNQSGALLIRAEKIGKDSVLSQIIDLVDKAQNSRAPIQDAVDKISGVFVRLVLLAALFTVLGWVFFADAHLSSALIKGVAVLIVACPCTLGLATPMSIMVGMGRAAKDGILIKNAKVLEKFSLINTLVMDKTGTLTEGKAKVNEWITIESTFSGAQILSFVASLAQKSAHPLSQAIVRFAKNSKNPDFSFKDVGDFVTVTGLGSKGKIDGHSIKLGNSGMFSSSLPTLLRERAEHFQTEGQMTVFASIDDKAVCLFSFSDPIKENSVQSIAALHTENIHVVMLTGDNSNTANFVAARLNIDDVQAEKTPQEKIAHIISLQEKGRVVAMTGDGYNDAPALAQADVGIAMGTGSDAAIATADMTIVKGDLKILVKALHLSRRIRLNIRQNLFFSFFYNTLSIPIAAGLLPGVELSPMLASVAMSASSLLVIGNALRLRR